MCSPSFRGNQEYGETRSLQPDAADFLLHIYTVAAVHPGGDEGVAGPGVAGVIAHPVVLGAVHSGIGEGRGQLPVGAKALAAVFGDGGECLVVDIAGIVAVVKREATEER